MGRDLLNAVLLAVICTTLVVAEKRKWLPNEIPNPLTDPEACGRGAGSYVCDPNNLINSADVARLDGMISATREQTTCECSEYQCYTLNAGGAKIGVAIVREMLTPEEARGEQAPKYDLREKLDEAAKFAQYIDSSWNIGQCGEAIIIFYSANDHVLYTHTGTEVRSKLTNSYLSEISMKHRIKFEKGDYYTGLAEMIDDYKEVLLGSYRSGVNAPAQPPEPQPWIQAGASSIGISLLTFIATLLLHL